MEPDDFLPVGNKLGKLNQLLERSGIDPDDISRVERVNLWEGFLKGPDGEAEKVDLAGISLVPRWADGPLWDPVRRGPSSGSKAKEMLCESCLIQLRATRNGSRTTRNSAARVTDESAINRTRKGSGESDENGEPPNGNAPRHFVGTASPPKTSHGSFPGKETRAGSVAAQSPAGGEPGTSTTITSAVLSASGAVGSVCVVCSALIAIPSSRGSNVSPRPSSSTWQTAVILPDIQLGYFRAADGNLEATHDEAALSVALAITKAAKPSVVVMVGDNMDLPELSKYRSSPAFAQTTQATVDRATTLCAQVRASAPDAEIVWLAGNHEERLPKYLIDNAMAAFGLRQGNIPDSWPVMSVPFLCRMDEFGVTYVPGYPASHHWVTPRLKVIHGELVRNQASTATAYLGREKTSVIFGHVHRREYAARTRDDHDGPREVMAASPGCLARTDGAVPSTKGGLDLDGRPVYRSEDWQQGVAVVPFDSVSGDFAYEQVAIHHTAGQTWGMWRGRRFVA